MAPAPLICVCIKPVWRTDVALRLHPAGHGLRADEALRVPNGADLAALRLALTLRASHPELRVLALTVGPAADETVLREALAAGADAVLRIGPAALPAAPGAVDGSGADTRARAAAVASALRPRSPALVLTGDRSADTGAECFGGFLAQALGADFAHRVTALRRDGDGWQATVRLERGYGQELRLAAPAVLTVPAQLPRPAYAALPAWLAARQAAVPVEAGGPAPDAGTADAETALRVPVPRVKRHPVPPSALDAEARIRAMVTFQPAGGGGTVVSGGTPREQAEAMLALLRERGYA